MICIGYIDCRVVVRDTYFHPPSRSTTPNYLFLIRVTFIFFGLKFCLGKFIRGCHHGIFAQKRGVSCVCASYVRVRSGATCGFCER